MPLCEVEMEHGPYHKVDKHPITGQPTIEAWLWREIASDRHNGEFLERLRDAYYRIVDRTETLEDVCNSIWGLIYPGKTHWEYPGQIMSHMRVELK